MPIFHALVLGIVQGLTEFLPVSSSAHLILVPYFLGWTDPGLTFDVALHLGTLVALIIYFWKDWLHLVRAWLASIVQRSLSGEGAMTAWLIIVATVPGGIIGALGDSWFEAHVRQPWLIGILLMAFAALLWAVDTYSTKQREVAAMTWMDSLVIGFSQALALFPGVSRSGATISAGLWRGLTREAATRFAFLLAAPITFGAVLFKLLHLVKDGLPADERSAFLVGILTSAVVGFAAIAFMLNYVRKQSLHIFVWYRVALGLITLLFFFMRQ